MILSRDLLTSLGTDIKFSENNIITVEGLYEECSAPMDDLSSTLNTQKVVKLEELLINFCADECLTFEGSLRFMRRMHKFLDAKYEKADIKKLLQNNVST